VVPGVGRGAEEGSFDSKGVKIHYLVEAQGEPVLLIHGFTGNLQGQWVAPGIVKALAKDYRVIALDNRGHREAEAHRGAGSANRPTARGRQ
jgi:pimeloyl-ACP methyl ester carboxylesterase